MSGLVSRLQKTRALGPKKCAVFAKTARDEIKSRVADTSETKSTRNQVNTMKHIDCHAYPKFGRARARNPTTNHQSKSLDWAVGLLANLVVSKSNTINRAN